MFRASPLLRSSGRRTLGARLASFRPPSITKHITRKTIRLASSSNHPPKPPPPNKEHDKIAQRKLETSEDVSATSSVRSILEPAEGTKKGAQDLNSSLKHDIDIVKDTFRLSTVPRESHILGLTGTLPYLATSLSTVFLALNLNREVPSGNRFYDAIFLDHETAQHLLDLIEPLQLGYGAVIISFLGAIHWGLEYAEKKPQHDRTRFRYGMGLGASIIAWPTLLMPLEYALTTQFGAFVALYYADSRATRNGWAPPWYAKYRFLLTAMVGLAIFISLVGRAKITQRGALNKKSLQAKLTEPGIADTHTNWAKLEKEEKDKIRKEKAKRAREEGQEKKRKYQEEKKGNKADEKKDEKDEGEKGKEDEEKGEDKDEKQDRKDEGVDKNKDAKEDANKDSQKGNAQDSDKSKDEDSGQGQEKSDRDSKPDEDNNGREEKK
ncbi:hypothetical protein V8C37DRAFT_409418 [Trichoderma ceciliae]